MPKEMRLESVLKIEHFAVLTALSVESKDRNDPDSNYVTYEAFPDKASLESRVRELISNKQQFRVVGVRPMGVKTTVRVDFEL